MAYLYGWGASVVILGALFKIQHYPGASFMLIIGLGTEAVIFFFSAFEPPHEDLDWSIVYPELAHMDDDEEHEEEAEGDAPVVLSGTVTEQLDRMLEDAKIGPELISSLSAGMKNLSESASNLTDLSEAANVTSEYSDKVKQASASIGSLNDAYAQGNQAMQDLANVSTSVKDNLGSIASSTEAYSNSMTSAAGKMDEMNTSYGRAVTALDEIASSSEAAKGYNGEMEKLTNSLSNLNSMYETDLQESSSKLLQSINDLSGTSDATKGMIDQMNLVASSLGTLNSSYANEAQESSNRVAAVQEFYTGLTSVMENLNASAAGAQRSREEVGKLGDNLAALNNVYGNMLAAMNIRPGGGNSGGGAVEE
ncbi:MAG: gliding motility protein GldL [Flavobacteriales bacterium]|nr:gliding motility protein GldL [Flavobacteriales bacterium]